MRLGPLIAAGFAGALLGGCGDDTPPPKPQKPVQLSVSAPLDTAVVQGATMQVRGTRQPARRARPRPGPRRPGQRRRVHLAASSSPRAPNVIDVAATASGRAAALTAFRVTREERVAVPDLVGLSVDDAQQRGRQARPQARGRARRRLPRPARARGGIGVCEQSPAPGKQVRRGTHRPRARRPRLLSQLRGVTAISPIRGSPRSRTMPSTIRPSIGSPSLRSTR